jgi:hypothetical protein
MHLVMTRSRRASITGIAPAGVIRRAAARLGLVEPANAKPIVDRR